MAEEITPPNSPRRRRIITNGTSKVIKLHTLRDDHKDHTNNHHLHHNHHNTTTTTANSTTSSSSSSILNVPPSLNYLAQNKNIVKSDEKDQENSDITTPTEVITWENLRESKKTAKIEKFLWNANISDDIGKFDNTLLKVP